MINTIIEFFGNAFSSSIQNTKDTIEFEVLYSREDLGNIYDKNRKNAMEIIENYREISQNLLSNVKFDNRYIDILNKAKEYRKIFYLLYKYLKPENDMIIESPLNNLQIIIDEIESELKKEENTNNLLGVSSQEKESDREEDSFFEICN